MIENLRAYTGSPQMVFILPVVGVLVLTALLFPILSGGDAMLFLGAITGTIGALVFFLKPDWGVLVILIGWFLGISSITKLVAGVLLIPLGLALLRDRGIWVWKVPQVRLLVVIGILFLISTWWSSLKYPIVPLPELDLTEEFLQDFFTRLVFLIFFLYFISTRERIELCIWVTIGLIVIAGVTSFESISEGGRARASITMAGNSNRLGFICLFATSFLWFYYTYGRPNRWKPLIIPFLFGLPVIALSTGSRSAFLQAVILTIIVIKQQPNWSIGKRTRGLLLLGTILVVLSVLVPSAQVFRATSFDPTISAPGQESLKHRLDRISVLIELAVDNPLLGIGIGNFRWMNLFHRGENKGPHNSYLWALTEGGIFVLSLYLILFYVTYRMISELERHGPPELLWVSKGLKTGLILFAFFTAFADFWLSELLYLIVGLTVAATLVWQRQQRQSYRRIASVDPIPSLV